MTAKTTAKSDVPTLSPVVREIPADLETPTSAYLKLRRKAGPSFLLESIEGGERIARYSFIGVEPRCVYVLRGRNLERRENGSDPQILTAVEGSDPFRLLEDEMGRLKMPAAPASPVKLPRFLGGLVGYLGFESVRYFEPRLDPLLHPSPYPEAVFLLADTIVAFDHVRSSMFLIAYPFDGVKEARRKLSALERRLRKPLPPDASAAAGASAAAPAFESNVGQERYERMVLDSKEHIVAGDVFQVLPSQRLSRTTKAAPFDIYRALRRLNPSPYMFFFDFGNVDGEPFYLAGSSPEVFVRLEGDKASLRPIAGTSPRGASPEQDAAIEQKLLADPKERAEHVMLVDLGRNDLGRVCRYGSVDVPEYAVIERYSHVMHIVSQVEGEMRPGKNAFDLVRAAFPAGTVSGAPKVRAVEIIAELEPDGRGPYGGAVGYFSFDGSMDTCLAIRTLIGRGKTVSVQAGAGIVADSDPHREYQETMNKARAVLLAVEQAEGLNS
ncbi:MAG: anthranilate synthase component I [Anaerolineales bacterium]|nr:anthranilate synthase component I [Anaerolineales bacterium]